MAAAPTTRTAARRSARVIFEAAHVLGLLPLVWLALLHLAYHRRDAAWWWLAGVFGVSFAADTAAHWVNPDVVGNAYPMMQAVLVALILRARSQAVHVLGLLLIVSLVAIWWQGPTGPDVLLRTVAWGTIVGLVWPRWELGWLRGALLVTFGGGLFAWYGYTFAPGWETWGVYQLTRAIGTLVFCGAALHPAPSLRWIPPHGPRG